MFNYRFYLNSFKVINIYDILFLLKIIRIACHLSSLFTHSYTPFSFLFLFFSFSTLPVFILYSLLFYRLRFFSFFLFPSFSPTFNPIFISHFPRLFLGYIRSASSVANRGIPKRARMVNYVGEPKNMASANASGPLVQTGLIRHRVMHQALMRYFIYLFFFSSSHFSVLFIGEVYAIRLVTSCNVNLAA